MIVRLLLIVLGLLPSLGQSAPQALSDSYTTPWSEILRVEAPGVLGNDSDPDDDPLTAHLLESPARGTLSLRQDGSFSYTPEYAQSDPAIFVYKAWDGRSFTTATVTINITVGNHKPEPLEDAYTIELGSRLEVAAPGVLENDSDPDGDPLTTHLYQDVAYGHLGFHQDGSFWYDPQGFVGTTTFQYGAFDGQYKQYATVTLTVIDPTTNHPPTITSSPITLGAPHQAYIYQVVAADPEDDPLTFSITGPPGIDITQEGRISWVPDTPGSYPTTVIVSDGTHQVEQVFDIEVGETSPVNRPPRITSEPTRHILLEPIRNEPQPINLQNWVQWNYGGSPPNASWQVSDDGTSVYQPHNSRPSLYVGSSFYTDAYITGTLEVTSQEDDDYIGFAITQGRGRILLFKWKQGNQDVALRGMSLDLFQLPPDVRPDVWPTLPDNGELLYQNNLGWQEFHEYHFALELHPGEITITIRDADETLVDQFHVVNDQIEPGYFALYNYSQQSVWYRALAIEPLATRTYTYEATARDDDGDTLLWEATGPTGLSIDPETGFLYWNTTSEEVGSHPITITVRDPHGGVDTQNFILTVSDENPVIVSTPPTRIQATQEYRYDVAALSPGGSPLSYTLETSPAGMIIDAQSGLIDWQPTISQIGNHTVHIQAHDEAFHYDEQEFVITVRELENQPPRITGDLPSALPFGKPWSHVLTVEDEGPLSFHLIESPATMAINSATGLMAWTPDQLGEVRVTVAVRDEEGLETRLAGTLLIEANTAPTINTQFLQYANATETYSLTLTGSDPDGDVLSWHLHTAPFGVSLDQNILSWTPTQEQIGTHQIEIGLTDGVHLVPARFSVTVIGENTPPVLSGEPGDTARVGDPYGARFFGYDAEGQTLTFEVEGAPGATIDPGGLLRLVPFEQGTFSITVHLRDGFGGVTSLSYDLTVTEHGAPVFTSTPPTQATELATYRYSVKVNDPNGDSVVISLESAPEGMQLSGNTITWVPGSDDQGIYPITIGATDSYGYASIQAWDLTVSDAQNTAPVITSNPPTEANEGEIYTYVATALDPDGDPLSFSITGPSGMSIDQEGIVQWTPGATDQGNHTVTLTVRDNRGGQQEQVFTLQVFDTVNVAPIIEAIPDQNVRVGETLTVQVTASDGDNDPLEFSAIDEETNEAVPVDTFGTLTFVPATIEDTHITVSVSDGRAPPVATSFLVVVRANAPPVFLSEPQTRQGLGDTFTYTPVLHDPDGDEVTLSIVSAPTGLQLIDGVIGYNATKTGIVEISLRATDAFGASTEQDFTLETQYHTNTAPRFISDPIVTAQTGIEYVYDADVVDPDGFPITFALLDAPEGMTLDRTRGILTWIPELAQIGTHTVSIQVIDDKQASDEQSFSIGVTNPGDITPPQVFMNLDKVNVAPGEEVHLQVASADNVGVVGLSAVIIGDGTETPIGLDGNASATFSSLTPGVYTAKATAIDAAGNSASHSQDIWVRDPQDETIPTVLIHGPAKDSVITAPTPITITVQDENLAHWQLELARNGQECFQTLAEGSDEVVEAAVADLDPTLLQNGLYTLRLTAFDVNNQGQRDEAVTLFEGEMKVGRFTMGFLDLERSLKGIPIQVNRLYDSGDKCPGDFGYGWNLADADIQASITLGRLHDIEESSYCVSGSGAIRYPPYDSCSGVERSLFCLEEVVSHYATVTMPDGTTHQFDLILEPEGLGDNWENCRRDYPPEFVNTRFEARDGTHSNLEVIGNSRLLYRYLMNEETGQNEWMALDTNGDPWNPTRFRLTTRDGIVMTLHARRGIESLTDLEGNTVSYSETAISHSSGETITLERDGQNRITRITDPKGNELRYDYDEAGDLTAFTDAEGNTTRFEYDAYHNLIAVTDPTGNIPAKWYYDEDGRLIAEEDAYGHKISYDHDIEGRQEVIRDRAGNTTVYIYDEWGQVLSQTDATGNTTTYAYDAQHREIRKTLAAGTADESTTSRSYDSEGNLTSQTNALGHTTTIAYQGVHLSEITDDRGQLLGLSYDVYARPLSLSGPTGTLFDYSYSQSGSRTEVVSRDALGHELREVYNWRGRLIEKTDAYATVTFEYDGRGNLLLERRTDTRVDGSQRTLVSQWFYDRNGNLIRAIDPEGNESVSEYDALGREVAAIDAFGTRTEASYDARGQLTRISFPDGSYKRWTYDVRGNLKSETDRLGRTTSFAYDVLGRLILTTAPDGSTTELLYDGVGRVISERNARGFETRYEYDRAGNRTAIIDALGNRTDLSYRASGELLRITNALGHSVSHTYTSPGLLSATDYEDGTREQFGYDALGRRQWQEDRAGVRTSFARDESGRLTAITDGLGNVTRYRYDSQGNLLGWIDALGRETRSFFDGNGQRIEHVLPMGQSTRRTFVGDRITEETDFAGKTTRFDYDASGREIRRDYADGSFVQTEWSAADLAVAVETSAGITRYDYDLSDRLILKENWDGSWVRYSYDANGNRTSVVTAEGTTSYSYDALDRLETVTDRSGNLTRYFYDAVGNLTESILPNGVISRASYDDRNQLIDLRHESGDEVLYEASISYDAVGNQTEIREADGRTVSYHYDALRRLIEESITDSAGTIHYRYDYDAVGNRLAKSLNGVTEDYLYDANDRLLEVGDTSFSYDANGNTVGRLGPQGLTTYRYNDAGYLVEASGAHHVTYSYDAAGLRTGKTVDGRQSSYLLDTNQAHAVVLERRDDSGLTRFTYGHGRIGDGDLYDLADAHGDVVVRTDGSGELMSRHRYDAFGNQLLPSVVEFGYTGEQHDNELGLIYLRARHYDPSIGRFHGRDSFQGDPSRPLSLNKYLYAEGNPVMGRDPSGYFTLNSLLVGSGIGALIGASSTVAANYALGQAQSLKSILIGASAGAILGPLSMAYPAVGVAVAGLGVVTSGAMVKTVFMKESATGKQKVAASALLIASLFGGYKAINYARGLNFGTGKPQVYKNKVLGDKAVQSFVKFAKENGIEVVGQEVYVRSPFYKIGRRYDVIIRHPRTGELVAVEIKSTPAAFRKSNTRQEAADKYVKMEGGELFGKNAKDLAGEQVFQVIKILWTP